MSEKQYTKNDRGELAKMPGYFSWRHQSRAAHDEARGRYLNAHGKAARQGVAEGCAEVRECRTDAEQIAALDKRLGKGKGAKRERARLAARMAAA